MGTENDKDYAVFTACNVAYLDKALALAESLRAHGNARLKIYVFDGKRPLPVDPGLAEIVWIEDAGFPAVRALAFKYDVTEFSTSLKPFISLELLKTHRKVIYLDPDILVYSGLTPVLADLDSHPIVLTPHYTTPQAATPAESDMNMMRFGSFNLGFFAVSRDEEALAFLNWWSDRCVRLGFFESQFGLSTDQKWVSIAPCLFRRLYVSFDPGYNAAFWNSHERTLSKGEGGAYLVNGKHPLVFYHFSSFDEESPENLSRRHFSDRDKKRADLAGIAVEYKQALGRHKIKTDKKYAFDYMSGGEYISPTLRRAYACVAEELPAGHDPFDSKGPVADFARKNFLFERRPQRYVPGGYGDMAAHKGKFAVIYSLMRLALRLLGPNQFANLSRLLVYLSSYRQNRGLWKV